MKPSVASGLKDAFLTVDAQIKAGRIQAAAGHLARVAREFTMKRWSHEDRVSFAELCRRSGLFTLGLRTLAPLIRGDAGLLKRAPVRWMTTYAALLTKVGSLDEAIQILSLQTEADSDIDLYLAYAHLGRWDYKTAGAHLERYLKWPGLGDYQRMVGMVNLAAAQVKNLEFGPASELLGIIRQECHARNWKLLSRNSMEISAELAIEVGDLNSAEQFIGGIESETMGDRYDLFVALQRSRLVLLRFGPNAKTLGALAEVRKTALGMDQWEPVRIIDSVVADRTENQGLADRVFFGTPYPSFRERLLERLSSWYCPSEHFIWTPGDEPRSARRLDVARGREADGPAAMKAGQANHRLLVALTADFYRPASIGALHSQIFPTQYFNPMTAPQRVANVVNRLRTWCMAGDLDVQISMSAYRCQINPSSSVAFEFHLSSRQQRLDDSTGFRMSLEKLKSTADGAFKSELAARRLNLSLRSANNLLKWGCDHQILERFGRGRATRYKFSA